MEVLGQLSQLALIITILPFIKLPKNCVKSLKKRSGLVGKQAMCVGKQKKANEWILNKLSPAAGKGK